MMDTSLEKEHNKGHFANISSIFVKKINNVQNLFRFSSLSAKLDLVWERDKINNSPSMT